jgi:hypothetical protein
MAWRIPVWLRYWNDALEKKMKTFLGRTEFGWALFIYLSVLTLFVMAAVG